MFCGGGRGAAGAMAYRFFRPLMLMVAACALAGCTHNGQPSVAGGQPRGATVAFESIDGPPPGQFQTLVRDLNAEAQSRRLAVISRENPSAYRVRGYLAAKVAKAETTIAWVWDVFDRNEKRALRIVGEEIAKGRHRDGWNAADDAMLRRIARSSMDQLAAFLTSPDAAPNLAAAGGEPPVAFVGLRDTSPEAAGIFRIFRANADPMPSEVTETAPAAIEAIENAGPVPLPRRRPGSTAALSAGHAVTLSALRH